MFVVGFGAAAAATMAWSSNPGAYPYVAYLACAAVGLVLLARAFAGHWAFRRKHPYIEDFYTDDQRAAIRRGRKRFVVGGAALIAFALLLASPKAISAVEALGLWGPVMSVNRIAPLLFWGAVAAGVALIMHGIMAGGIVRVARYNRAAEQAAERGAAVAAAVDAALLPESRED